MHDRVGPEALGRPFFVQWGWAPNGDWGDSRNDERFASLDEALRRYDELKHAPELPVWLGEVGDFTTPAGNVVRDWIYFVWNAPVEPSQWGPCPARGRGYPHGTWTRRLVNYESFLNQE